MNDAPTHGGTIVLLSGGQDSTTALFWAIRHLPRPIIAVNFDYGQRHALEMEAAREIAGAIGVPLHVLPLPAFKVIGGCAMLEGGGEVALDRGDGLPTTFLPGRNLVMVLFAAALGVQQGCFNVVMGVSEADFSGYPDCRREALEPLELAIQRGMDHRLRLFAPFLGLSKADEVMLAKILPGCWEALAKTVTCYHGQRPGCAQCPACKLRAKGFAEAGQDDPAMQVQP